MINPNAHTNAITRYAIAAVLCVLVGASYLLDGPDDTQAAQDVAAEAEYAAALADGGRAKCGQLGRTPVWTPDGDLICRARGEVVAQSAKE